MTGRRAIIGLSLLCALVFSAFAAPNAMALKGTTAFTCKVEAKPEKTTKGFEDEHCTKPVEGEKVKFVHQEVPPNTSVGATVQNTETGSKLVFPKLKSIVGGVAVELEAAGGAAPASCITKSNFKNVESGTKQMEIQGEGCGELMGVVVNKPAKCTVKEGIVVLSAGGFGKSVVKEVEGKSEMYGEAIPPEGKPFAEFTFEGAECALKGTVVKVTGTARFNTTTEEGKLDGATVKSTTAETGKTLKIGANAAEVEGTGTVRVRPTIGQEESPLVVTTTAN